jgi:asparagine synthase (glutamine-hydrolysing)
MCGISGFNWEDKELIKKMTKTMSHRGPDDIGHYTDKNISLGHNRLSIIDLSKAGHQPMSNKEGTIWITYNGEIYNFKEIRKELEKKKYKFNSETDTEVIIYSYQEWGEKCLEKFNGIFAFCIYDTEKKKLFLARDRLGVKPLYYYLNEEKFIFASEIKAILEHKIERKVNLTALNNYITLRYNSGMQTLFEKIQKIPAGYYAIFDIKTKKNNLQKYWNLNLDTTEESKEYFKEKLYKIFKGAVKKQLISDVPLGVFLSGGVDSGSIVALMHEIKKEEKNNEETKTFTVGFEQGEFVNELEEAKYISERFSTKHKEFIVKPSMVKLLPKIIWHLDEPMADPALIPLYLLAEKAKKEVSVVLTGDGGDEVFGGYDQYKFLMMGQKLSKIPFAPTLIPTAMKFTPKKILNKFYKHTSSMGQEGLKRIGRFLQSSGKNPAKAYNELVGIYDEEERQKILNPNKFQETNYNEINKEYFSTGKDFLKKLLYFDTKRLLPESFLMKTDRMTMAHSIEARVPLLDHELVEFGFTIPSKYKINQKRTKYILRETMTKLIPESYLYKKKQTFHVPIENWIDNELKDYCKETLSEENIKRQGYFNYKYIEKILENYKKSKLFYARQLWNLITFNTWHKIYMHD